MAKHSILAIGINSTSEEKVKIQKKLQVIISNNALLSNHNYLGRKDVLAITKVNYS